MERRPNQQQGYLSAFCCGVAHNLSYNPFSEMHPVGGIGFRAIAEPFAVRFVDVGWVAKVPPHQLSILIGVCAPDFSRLHMAPALVGWYLRGVCFASDAAFRTRLRFA